jgi:hypothetical protein
MYLFSKMVGWYHLPSNLMGNISILKQTHLRSFTPSRKGRKNVSLFLHHRPLDLRQIGESHPLINDHVVTCTFSLGFLGFVLKQRVPRYRLVLFCVYLFSYVTKFRELIVIILA